MMILDGYENLLLRIRAGESTVEEELVRIEEFKMRWGDGEAYKRVGDAG